MLLTLLACEMESPCGVRAREEGSKGFRAAAGCWLPCESTEVLLRLSGV